MTLSPNTRVSQWQELFLQCVSIKVGKAQNSYGRMDGSKFKVINSRSSIWTKEKATVMTDWGTLALAEKPKVQVEVTDGRTEGEDKGKNTFSCLNQETGDKGDR